jgi:NADH-quinone oxidoreductase subunit N
MQIIYALSLMSMVVGAFAGLVQKNVYRLLAYSSIGHMGYVLLGVLAGTEQGLTAALTYIAIYMVMTAGTFALLLSIRNKDVAVRETSGLSGLSSQSPKTAYGLTILLFSMSGIPPMAGFFGKLFVFQSALVEGYLVLAIIGVLTSVVAAYYYLAIIKTMFFDNTSVPNRDVVNSRLLNLVAYPTLAFTMFYILFPNWLVYEAGRAAQSIIN